MIGIALLIVDKAPANSTAAARTVLRHDLSRIELVLLKDRDDRPRHDVVAATGPERDRPVQPLAGIGIGFRQPRGQGRDRHGADKGTCPNGLADSIFQVH